MDALRLTALAVAAGDKRLLEGVELTLGAGEIIAIKGPSGSGKTSLLRAVAGLSDPLAGEVRLDGRTPAQMGWPAFRRRVIYLAQRPAFLDASVHKNLALPFSFATAAGPELDDKRAEQLLDALGLDDVMGQRARTLSEGQKQRVALVRALLLEPDVLLLDEPTSALDPDTCNKVEALLHDAKVAALLVTHDAEQVARLATRCIDLADHAPEPAHG